MISFSLPGGGIIRTSAPVKVIVHYPTTLSGKRILADRVASAHAEYVARHIEKLNVSRDQKLRLLDAVISDVQARSTERDR